jgi:hypothetical protein
MIKTITWNTKGKMEKQRKVKRCATYKNQRKERASPSCDRKLSYPQPFMSLACTSRDLIMVEGLK